jgi:hypothetical protein
MKLISAKQETPLRANFPCHVLLFNLLRIKRASLILAISSPLIPLEILTLFESVLAT